MSGLEVVVDLMNHPFLSAGEVKRQGFVQGVKTASDKRHSEPGILLTPFHLSQNLQLNVEQFLEFESCPCVLHGEGVFREMDVHQRVFETHEPVFLQHIRSHRVLYAGFEVRYQFGNNGT